MLAYFGVGEVQVEQPHSEPFEASVLKKQVNRRAKNYNSSLIKQFHCLGILPPCLLALDDLAID